MIRAMGKITVESHKGRIVLNVNNDFIRYYKYFIEQYYWIRMNSPMHGAHITIANTIHHPKINWNKAVWYDKKEVEFTYDPYVIEGGYRKGFLMYYIRVFSKELDDMKRKLGIVDGVGYRGLHLTLANSKNGSVFPDWPKMIEIKK